jgi:PAS domain S-box-containing protein
VRRRSVPWLVGGLVAEVALAVVDIATGDSSFGRTWYLLPVLAMALGGRSRDVGLVGGLAFVLALVSPLWHGSMGDNWALPMITVVAGAAIAVFAARQRESAERARASAEAERAQLQLLGAAARITDGAVDIDEALRRLLAVLVPAMADAAWVDVIDPGGAPRRLAARADGPDREAIEAWLMGRADDRSAASPTTRVLQGEGGRVAELAGDLRESMIHDESDRRNMDTSGLRWTIALPLAPSGGPLGALGMAVGPSGRTYGEAELAFARLLVGRAGLALANAQLVHRLTSAQRRLDGILGSLAEAVTVQDRTGGIVYANERAAFLLGLPDVASILSARPGELVGRFEIHHPDGAPVSPEELPGYRVLRGETPPPLLTRSVLRATGELHWFLTKATLLVDAGGEELAVNVIEDVTEEQEAALRVRFLAEAGRALGSSLDLDETLQRVARLVVPRMADWCAVELPDEKGILQQVALAHVDPERVAAGRAMRERWPPQPDAPSSPYEVLRTGAALLVAEVPDELLEAVVTDPEQLAAVRALGLNSALTVPMIARDRTLGVMSFVFSESGRRYTEDDILYLQEVAGRAATAIENARLYTERSQVARTLQDSLLPDELRDVPGWRFAAGYQAGQREAEVGGDFYDSFPVAGGHMVLLGDVTGKGVRAAALTSLVRYTARTAAGYDPTPSAVLARVNRALRERPLLAPVTMLVALLRDDGTVLLGIGGHPLPLLRRSGARCRPVGQTGMLLGAVHDYELAQNVPVPLTPGDLLLLYTDGVTDTPGEHDRFGDARLREALDAAPADPDAVLADVFAAVDRFAIGDMQDDRAMLAVLRA